MRQIGRQILRASLAELAGDISADLGGAAAQTKLQMIRYLLTHLLLMDETSPVYKSIEDEVRSVGEKEEAERRIVASGVVRSKPEGTLSAEVLTAYVREETDDPRIVVTDVQASLGGFSKQTLLLTLTNAEKIGNRLVIRRDQEGGPVESHVADEFAVINLMHDCGVPVPEPLWADRSPPFGGTCLVTRMVLGKTVYDITGVQVGEGGRAACLALARVLAKIHRTPLKAMNLPAQLVNATLGDHVRRMIRAYEEQWKRRRVGRSPTLQAAFEWLIAKLPEHNPASLVHGDASLRNLLMHDGHETAILDWELWHIGDHNEDLAYCRTDVEKFLPWEEFLAEYKKHGGLPVHPAAIDYYEVFCAVRNAVFAENCLHSFENNTAPDLKLAYGALALGRVHIRRIAERITAAILGAPTLTTVNSK
jgi:aminoglycoside phosphotransferase (APT) family kinase protein